MRTLLRHALTGLYYKAQGKWTSNPDEAHHFEVVEGAMSFARKTKCPNLELDIRFDNPMRAASFRLQELFAGI